MRRVNLTESEWEWLVKVLEFETGSGTGYVDPCCDGHFPLSMRTDISRVKNKLRTAERTGAMSTRRRREEAPVAIEERS